MNKAPLRRARLRAATAQRGKHRDLGIVPVLMAAGWKQAHRLSHRGYPSPKAPVPSASTQLPPACPRYARYLLYWLLDGDAAPFRRFLHREHLFSPLSPFSGS